MRKLFILAILLLSSQAIGANLPTTYYVDQTGGNDSNSGFATDNAWKTISLVNSFSHTNYGIFSEQLNGQAPLSTAPDIDNAIAPDGNATAEVYTSSDGGGPTGFYVGINYVAARTDTLSIFGKAIAGTPWMVMDFNNAANKGAVFNLSTGTIGFTDNNVTSRITSVGNGWYRCSITMTTTEYTGYPEVYFSNSETANGRIDPAGGGLKMAVWGWMYEIGSYPSAYIPTTTVAVTASFQPGDSILFKRGCTWREQLTVPSSGSAGNPITFGAYGSGAKPIISGADVVTTWTAEGGSPQTSYDAGAEIDTYSTAPQNYGWVVPAAMLTTSGSQVRVQLAAASGTNWVIDGASICEQGTGADCANGTLTRLTFDTGSNTVTITANTATWSDWITYSIDETKSYIVKTFGTTAHGATDTRVYAYSGYTQYYVSSNTDYSQTEDVTESSSQAGRHGVKAVEVQGAGNAYSATLTTEPHQVFYNGTILTPNDNATTSVGSSEWDWVDNVVYVNVGEDPDDGTLTASVRDYGIVMNAKSFITINDLQTSNANTNGIWIYGASGSHDITMDNVTSTYNWRDGISANSSSAQYNGIIQNSTVSYNGAVGIAIRDSFHDWNINHNTITYNSRVSPTDGDANHAFSGGIYVWGNDGGYKVTIEYNYVGFNGLTTGSTNTGNGIWIDDSVASPGNEHIIRYNRSTSNNVSGIFLEISQYVNAYYNITDNNANRDYTANIMVKSHTAYQGGNHNIYNNVSYGSNRRGLYNGVFDDGGVPRTDNVVFRNNISIGSAEQELYAENGGANDTTHGTGNVYDHNALGAQATNFIYWDANKSTYDAFIAASSQSDTNVETDPLFVSTVTPDFHLQSASPAINAGVNLSLSSDYEGNAPGNPPEMGAYEYLNAGAWYVDATLGVDTDNGTISAPWKTIAKVNAAAFNPGNSIYFNKGETWAEQLTIPSSGTNGNQITFDAYGDGALPILDADNTRDYGILLNAKSYITLKNMNITNGLVDGIRKAAGATWSDGIQIDNVTTAGNVNYGIRLYGVRNSSIKNSTFGTTTDYDGIYIGALNNPTDNTPSSYVDTDNNTFTGSFGRWCVSFTGCNNCSITNSTFTPTDTGTSEATSGVIDIEPNAGDNTSNLSITGNHITVPILSAAGFGIQSTVPAGAHSDNVNISGNTIDMGDTGAVSTVGIKFSGTNGGSANNNVLTRCGGTASYGMMIRGAATGVTASFNKVSGVGLQCYAFATTDTATGAYYYNIADNVLVPFQTGATSTGTFYNNTANEFYYRGFNVNTGSNIVAKNNILRTTDIGNQVINDNTTGTKEFDYNIYYTADTTNIFTTGITNYNTMALWTTGTGQDAHSIQADPLFVSSSDFHLQAGSPARNAGVDVGLTTDYAGNIVPNGSVPDIGAYEYYSSSYGTGLNYLIPCMESFFGKTSTESLMDAIYRWFNSRGFSVGGLNQRWNEYLISLGYTQPFPENQRKYFQDRTGLTGYEDAEIKFFCQ